MMLESDVIVYDIFDEVEEAAAMITGMNLI